jgi:hypothetical protein
MSELGYIPLQPIEGGPGGCAHCGFQHSILPLNAIIAVGFGSAWLSKDAEIVYEEPRDPLKIITVAQAETLAATDPKHDWRIHLVAPLSERHYQRQGEKHWVLYEKGQGFA